MAVVYVVGSDGERYDVVAHWLECLSSPSSEDFATREEIAAVLDALDVAGLAISSAERALSALSDRRDTRSVGLTGSGVR